MRNQQFLSAVIVLLFSCKNAGVNVTQESSAQFKEDSAAIFQVFAKGLSYPDSIGVYYKSARNIAGENNRLKDYVRFNLARNSIMLGDFSKADSILTRALKDFEKDSLNYASGKYYNLKASLLIYGSEQTEAINYFKKALEVFENQQDNRQAAAVEFNMAQLFLGNLDYKKVYEYSMASHAKLEALADTLYLPIVKGMAAVSSAITGKIQDAEKFAREGLAMSEQYKNMHGLIFAKYAYGEIETQKNNYETAISYLKESKELAQKVNLQQVVLPNNAAILKCYLLLNRYDSAVQIGEESLELSKKLKMADIQYNLLKNTSKAYAGLGNFSLAYDYMSQAEEHYRFKSNESNQRIVHELLIKYDAEKKNNQILLQQKKITKKNQSVLILGAVVFIVLLALFFYRKNNLQEKKLLLQRRENDMLDALAEGEENERTRLADELHDGVASNLVALKLQLENASYSEAAIEKSLDLIKHTNKELRYLAHRMMPVNFETRSLPEAIKEFCGYCSVPAREVRFITNVEKTGKDTGTKMMLYRAVQEMVQNAMKHAGASEITVQLLAKNNSLELLVEDNGCGFDMADENYLSGFESLNRRVKMFNGKMEIGSEKNKGTSVFITL